MFIQEWMEASREGGCEWILILNVLWSLYNIAFKIALMNFNLIMLENEGDFQGIQIPSAVISLNHLWYIIKINENMTCSVVYNCL